jgi:hypothetical protein
MSALMARPAFNYLKEYFLGKLTSKAWLNSRIHGGPQFISLAIALSRILLSD